MFKQKINIALSVFLIISYSNYGLAQVAPIEAPRILISEVQTNGEGTGTTDQEFVELYNPTDSPVDLLGWKLVYRNSSGNDSTLFIFVDSVVLLPSSFYVGKLTSANSFMPEFSFDFNYSSALAATSAGLMLKDSEDNLIHSVSWKSSTAYVDENTVVGLVGGKSAQITCDSQGIVKFSGITATDYTVGMPSLGTIVCDEPVDIEPLPDEELAVGLLPDEDGSTDASSDTAVDDSDTDENEASAPGVEGSTNDLSQDIIPELQPQVIINELFIDPKSPLLDSVDEFVEIFNPNDVEVDMSGYKIVAGINTKYNYTYGPSQKIAPGKYLIIRSKDTPIALANSGGRVELFDSYNRLVDSVDYKKAEAGLSWALNSVGAWEWTSTSTPEAQNLISMPLAKTVTKTTSKKTSVKSAKISTKSNKKSNFTVAPPIQISEILPDPKSPQTDAKDEFIELYNPYPYAINIADYTLTASSATKTYSYVLPQGSVIQAQSYLAITSEKSPISLNNNGAKVSLINNFDKEIDSTTYEKSSPGQSWARDQFAEWRWTGSITMGAENIFVDNVSSAVEKSKTVVAGVSTNDNDVSLTDAPQPLRPWALALIGFSAVCYASYEYRFELRNYIYRFRLHRSVR